MLLRACFHESGATTSLGCGQVTLPLLALQIAKRQPARRGCRGDGAAGTVDRIIVSVKMTETVHMVCRWAPGELRAQPAPNGVQLRPLAQSDAPELGRLFWLAFGLGGAEGYRPQLLLWMRLGRPWRASGVR